MKRRWIGLAAIAFVALLALLWTFTRTDPAEQRADLIEQIQIARDGLIWPGESIEEVATNLGNADAALAFVQDGIVLADYSGSLIEPKAVLGLRAANGLDKAGLLAAILRAQGADAAVMTADWPAVAAAHRGGGASEPVPQYLALADYLGLDREQIAQDRLLELEKQTMRLRSEVDAADTLLSKKFGAVDRTTVPSLRARYWVVSEGAVFDPMLPDGPVPAEGTAVELAPEPIMIEIIAEDSDGQRDILLAWSGMAGQEMVLAFQPVLDGVAGIDAPPNPTAAPVWAPVLSIGDEVVSGKPFAPDAGALPALSDPPPPPDTMQIGNFRQIRALEILDLQPNANSQVEMILDVDASGTGGWAASQFLVLDNGVPVRAKVATLPDTDITDRPIILALDMSASMSRGDRAFSSNAMAHAIADTLSNEQPIAVVAVTSEPRLVRSMAAKSSGDLTEEIDSAFLLSSGLDLQKAIEVARGDFSGPVSVVFIGDGAVNELKPQVDVEFFGIAVNSDPADYNRFGTAWQWDAIEPPERLAQELSDAMSPRLALRWQTPAGEPGETRQVELTARDFDGGPSASTYVVPTAEPGPIGALILTVSVPGSDPAERKLATLGEGHSNWSFEGLTRIAVSPAPPPDRFVLAKYLDAWLEVASAQDGEPLDVPEGPSFWMLNRASGLAGYASLAAGEELRQSAPMVIVERIGWMPPEADTITPTRTLDVVDDGGLHTDGAPWRAGLSLAAAEAEMLGVSSVSAQLMGSDKLELVGPADPIPDWTRELPESSGYGLASDFPDIAWLVDDQSGLQARLFNPTAKGARAEAAALEFAQLRSRLEAAGILAGAAGSIVGVAGGPLGAIVGLLDENMRLWCFSTVMMGYVGDEIAGAPTPGEGDPAIWEVRARALCELADPEGIQNAYGAAIASGYITGRAGDILSNASSKMLGTTLFRELAAAEGAAVSGFWGSAISASGLGPRLAEGLGVDARP